MSGKNEPKLLIMPQLLPFFFVNQFSFSFITLISLIYIFSKYILPVFTLSQVLRMYICKLSPQTR
jgi:F-type H+-transporting ATPase subunit 8